MLLLQFSFQIGEKNDEIEKLCEALENIPEKDQRFELQSDIDPSAMYPGKLLFKLYCFNKLINIIHNIFLFVYKL